MSDPYPELAEAEDAAHKSASDTKHLIQEDKVARMKLADEIIVVLFELSQQAQALDTVGCFPSVEEFTGRVREDCIRLQQSVRQLAEPTIKM